MTRLAFLLAALCFVWSPVYAGTVEIDFETPKLIGIDWLAAESYTDEASGVVFVGERAVGPVVNSATSACVDPANRDQKLGTGGRDVVGISGDQIYVYFPEPLQPPVNISFEIQALLNSSWKIVLFHPVGVEAAEGYGYIFENGGNCGKPGGPRGVGTVTATSDIAVSWAMISPPIPDTGGYVFVIDNMVIESPTFDIVDNEMSSWSSLKARFSR